MRDLENKLCFFPLELLLDLLDPLLLVFHHFFSLVTLLQHFCHRFAQIIVSLLQSNPAF